MPTGGNVLCLGNEAPLLSRMQRAGPLQSTHHIPAPASLGTGRASLQGKCAPHLLQLPAGLHHYRQFVHTPIVATGLSKCVPLRHYFLSLSSGWGTDV